MQQSSAQSSTDNAIVLDCRGDHQTDYKNWEDDSYVATKLVEDDSATMLGGLSYCGETRMKSSQTSGLLVGQALEVAASTTKSLHRHTPTLKPNPMRITDPAYRYSFKSLRVFALTILLAALSQHTPLHSEDLPSIAKIGPESALLAAEFIYPFEGRQTPECHASTIVETEDGLVAAWFGGKHENNPDVGIWVSRHEGLGWSKPVEVVDGSENESQEYACWNPVLFQPQNGPLMLFYKVGVNPRLWWGALVTSDDNGQTWSQPRRLGTSSKLFSENRNLLGPVKNKPIQLQDGSILCPSSTENQGWRIHFEITKDFGKTWEVIGPLQEGEKLDAIQPSIVQHADGRLQILCRTKQSVVGTSWSSDSGQTWGPMSSLELPNPNAGTDAITLADGRFLLVYNHSVREKKNGRQILNVAISEDGVHWLPKMTLENEGNSAGYSYPAVIQTSDGRVHITYTWRRQVIKHVVLDAAQL